MNLATVVVPLARIGECSVLVGRALGTCGVAAPAVALIGLMPSGPTGAAPAARH